MTINFIPTRKINKINYNVDYYNSPYFKTYFFEYARQSIKIALSLYGSYSDKTVLLPASLCPAVLQPFIDLNIKVYLYDLNEDFTVNEKSLFSLINKSVKFVYVIHYFGLIQDFRNLRNFCDEKGLVLIEDCALCGYNTKLNIGQYGHFSVFSLWKFLPISNGALLRINSSLSDIDTSKLEKSSIYYFVKYHIKNNIKNFLNKLKIYNFYKNYKLSKKEDNSLKLGFDKKIIAKKIFFYNKMIVDSENIFNFCSIRQNYFKQLSNLCLKLNVNFISYNIDKSVPYCFPLICDDACDLQCYLIKFGVETEISVNVPFDNPKYILNFNIKFPHITRLSKRILSIPIHQNICNKKFDNLLILITNYFTKFEN